VVVLIHGGPISLDWATRPRQWRGFQSIGELLAASGLNAVMFDHRFHRREETGPAIDDIELVLVNIGAKADELGVDDADKPELSVASQVESSAGGLPPMLIAAAGLEDVPGFKDGLNRFANASLSRSLPLDLMIHARGRHGFDVLDDDERTRDIFRRTIEFVRKHLE